jgi:hypothetical protein
MLVPQVNPLDFLYVLFDRVGGYKKTRYGTTGKNAKIAILKFAAICFFT